MTQVVKIYGPPGTGKTTQLKGIADRAIARYGPDRMAAITYTKAGAAELKTRLAAVMGLRVPADPWQAKRFLDQQLPWVGTIHSLAYRLIGRPPMVKLGEFLKSQGSLATGPSMNVDDIEGYAWAEPGRDEVEAALAIYQASRNRLIPLEEAFYVVPWGLNGPTVSIERTKRIVQAYEDYKRQTHRIDFDDMLTLALGHDRPPVDVVLSDEVQDNSPLLWQVADQWAEGADYYAMAGDPYQAIYLFSGARPALFIDHPGKLVPLGDSRRLTAHAAERAQGILSAAGYERDGKWLGTWTGVGDGAGRGDGSVFYLARTARLLNSIYDELEGSGIAYATMRGGGPLQTKAARAFRVLVGLRRTGVSTNAELAYLVEQCEPSYLPVGEKRLRTAQAKSDPQGQVTLDSLQQRWQRTPDGDNLGLSKGQYFERVFSRYGPQAFILEPPVKIGTIHSAKGREADVVFLVDSWATLPYQSATDGGDGELAEACVAYVGATRHRMELHFIQGDSGTPYPGF